MINKKGRVLTINIFILFGLFQVFIWNEHVTIINCMMVFVIFACLYLLYKKVQPMYSLQKWNAVVAIIISIINTLGNTEYYKNTISYWTRGWNLEHTLLFISTIGVAVIFYRISICIFAFWDRKHIWQIKRSLKFESIWNAYIREHVFIVSFFCIILGWLPWLILYYPGSINWDMHGQLAEFFHLSKLSNHHPVFSTLIIGTFALIGEKIGSYNIGIYLYILFQSIMCAGAYAYIIKYLNLLGCDKKICFLVMLWFAFFPLWGGMAQFGDKDILFCAVFCIYSIQTYKFILNKKEHDSDSFKNAFMYIFTGIISCLMRNNVIYMVILTIPFIVIGVETKKIRALFRNIFIITTVVWIVCVVYPVFDIMPASKSEALSLIFQQTARVVKEHGDELSKEQKETINNVLDYESIGLAYDPVLSDPVKRTYKLGQKDDKGLLKKYLKTWESLALEYPMTYIDAIVGNSFAYYSFTPPIDTEQPAPSERFFNNIIGRNAYMEKFEFSYAFNEKLRNGLWEYSEYIRSNYITGFFYQCACYTWFYVIVVLYLIKCKKIKKIGCIMLPLLTIAVCCVSPANDCFRYYITASAFSPMLLGLGLAVEKCDML